MTTRQIPASEFVNGVSVGVGQRCHCDICSTELAPNDRVEVLVTIGPATVAIATLRGPCCSRGELADGTERACWLVRGRLAASTAPGGHSRLILSSAEVADRTE
ncbi:hypothetical protein [Halopiger xanaduensis]|uniref:Uncharacterized protein n=1 Tax=Halopiger xanaduensis (strain DSM 18323 / JCM 14033 / SH-6) TaxID=797210 RepID=F8DEL4_HALXS|nr:hypothetical protein [Halopiger xanaduensis]AEH39451.1 hypothetical protein Halxa_0211 [Halopiger xanaduensis SH-6]